MTSSPIRLLWLVDSLGIGGAEALTVPFARTIDRSALDLTIVSMHASEGLIVHRLRAIGVRVVTLGARNLRDLAALRRLLALIRDEKIELIHAHLAYSTIWSAIASRIAGVPAVATLHVTPAAARALRPSARHRVLTRLRDMLMKKVANRWTRYVITVSAALRDEYVQHGLAPSKVRVIHNGIEVERFRRSRDEARRQIVTELDVPPDAPIAVTVSVLRPAKGIEVLLDAIRQIPGAMFLIIGDGPIRDDLAALAQQHGVADRIRWAGFRNDVEALLPGCDLFVHPSLDDAFPTVLLEALAAGLPIVATNVGGVPEIVTPGVTGMLVPPGDARRLADCVGALLRDPAELQRMRNAAVVSGEGFSTTVWVERLTALYREVLAESVGHEQRISVGA